MSDLKHKTYSRNHLTNKWSKSLFETCCLGKSRYINYTNILDDLYKEIWNMCNEFDKMEGKYWKKEELNEDNFCPEDNNFCVFLEGYQWSVLQILFIVKEEHFNRVKIEDDDLKIYEKLYEILREYWGFMYQT